jgi:3-oxoacyl-[acyl-carrier-protein] synthase II
MRLAITGYGVASPFGVGRASWEAALAKGDAARELAFRGRSEVLEGELGEHARTAEVWDFDPNEHLGDKGHRAFDRLTKLLIAAAKPALADSGLKRDGAFVEGGPDASSIGICSATAYGSLDAITELNRVAELEDPRYINPQRFPNTVINAAAGYVSIWEDLRAPNVTVVDGNCSALDAVLAAATHLAHRRAKAFLVGGGEIVSEPLYLALRRLGVLADGRTDGGGVEMGEGACYFAMERVEDAKARGARVLAEVIGYGTAFEPPRSEALLVHASADAVARAVREALAEAKLDPREVDVVASSAGGLRDVDGAEAAGLRSVLGDVPQVPVKRLTGETFGVSGAFALAHVLAWFGGAPVVPCANPPAKVGTAVITSVGFYGNASAIVVRAA